jgi:6-phosphogluconolactonase
MKALIRAVFILVLIAITGCGSDSPPPAANLDFLYVVGQGANSVQAFNVKSTGEIASTSVMSFPTNPRPVGMALHPSTNFLYVTSLSANTVSGYTVDHTSGVLTPVGTALSPVPTGPSPISAGINSGGQFLFVLNQGDATISIYSIDPARGILTQVGTPFPTGITTTVQAMVVSPKAGFLYVSSGTAPSTITGFSISGSGALAPAGSFTATAGSNIVQMTIDAKGQFLYAPDTANNQVLSLTIASSGALAPVAGSPFSTGTQPAAAAVDATGSFVYVSNTGSNNVSAFKSAAGVLTAISGSPYATQGAGAISATQPGFLTVDATNNFLYVSNVATKTIASFAINSADGTLTTVNNSPFAESIAASQMISTK